MHSRLTKRSYKEVVILGCRSAARVWPWTLNTDKELNDRVGVPSARAILVSEASSSSSVDLSEAVRKAVDDAETAAGAAIRAPAARFAATIAVQAVRVAAVGVADIDANFAAAHIDVVAHIADADLFAPDADLADLTLVEDEGLEALLAAPLWQTSDNPLKATWDQIKVRLASSPEYDFWIRWYEGLLTGRPVNQKILQEIALLPDSDWKEGAVHIGHEIAKIELQNLRAATPLAERLEWNNDERLFTSIPIEPQEDNKNYENVLDSLAEAVADMRPNGELAQHHMGIQDTLDKISRALETHPKNAQRLHDRIVREIARVNNLIASGVVPVKDDRLEDFILALDEAALDIRRVIPEVNNAILHRAQLRAQTLPLQERQNLLEVSRLIAEYGKDDLKDEIIGDADDVFEANPLDQGNGPDLTSTYRLISRLTRMLPDLSTLPAFIELLKTNIPQIFEMAELIKMIINILT